MSSDVSIDGMLCCGLKTARHMETRRHVAACRDISSCCILCPLMFEHVFRRHTMLSYQYMHIYQNDLLLERMILCGLRVILSFVVIFHYLLFRMFLFGSPV